MFRMMCAAMMVLAVMGCSRHKQPELKSPCVAADSNQSDSPCVKRPANAAWLG